jgi:riboflavin transporter FmnP
MHAIAISIFGDNPFARQLSMAASLSGIVLLIYIFILRITKNKILAFTASGLFIFSKQTIFSTTANISDLPGAFWVIFTTYLFYLLQQEKKDKSNTVLILSLSVGIWMTFLTREVNVILLIPLFLFFFSVPQKTRVKITLSVFMLGIPFAYLRYKVNGTFLTPSYGSGIFELLDWKWVKSSAKVEIFTILSYLGILIISVIPFKKNRYTKLEKVLMLQAFSALIFYAFYQFTGETWWDGRFIICCIPGLIVLSMIRTGKYLEIAREKLGSQGVIYGTSELACISVIFIVSSVTIYVNVADEKFSVSSYQYLLNEAPKFRTVEPTIKSMREVIPRGSIIVTMDLSASGRYYFNDYFKFLWKPGLEELSLDQIKLNFPKTYWIYNPSYTAPPKEIVEQLDIIRSNETFVIGELK